MYMCIYMYCIITYSENVSWRLGTVKYASVRTNIYAYVYIFMKMRTQ